MISSANCSPDVSSRTSHTEPEPPLPSGRRGRYRSRTRPFEETGSTALDDTVVSLGLAVQNSCTDRTRRYSDAAPRWSPSQAEPWCGKRMSERENDIEFDFFEESDTKETQEERPRRGPRPPVRPPTGLTPLLRLIGLISFAILIVLLLVLWVNGCREDKRKDAYRNYVQKVSGYADQSQKLGRQFNTLLTTTGTKESDVESQLSGLAGQQDQITDAARKLDPPGRLRVQDAHALSAFELRANG